MFTLILSETSEKQIEYLKNDKSQRAQQKAVKKALKYLQTNPRHPSLQSSPYQSLKGPNGEKVFHSYAQQNTPGAYRIFWYYDQRIRRQINVISITPHPDE